MRRKLILSFITALGFFFLVGCEKDETQAVLKSSPVASTLLTPSDNLVLSRNKANDALEFKGGAVDFGFSALTTYTLEFDKAGNKFANAVSIASANADTFNMKVLELNGKLLMLLDGDTESSIDMRVSASIASNVPTVYSATKTIKVSPYGLPRLDVSTNPVQKIVSAAGDGVYAGFVKFGTTAVSFKDPDANNTYGVSAGKLAIGAEGYTAAAAGWYSITANMSTLAFTAEPNMIGLVGSATPNGWNAPDVKMDYDAKAKCWYVTQDLIDGMIKFRLNDDWGWNVGGAIDNLTEGGADIPVTAGKYLVKLYIEGATKYCTLTKI
jgi:starch-binding outer membrane protein SusE/F